MVLPHLFSRKPLSSANRYIQPVERSYQCILLYASGHNHCLGVPNLSTVFGVKHLGTSRETWRKESFSSLRADVRHMTAATRNGSLDMNILMCQHFEVEDFAFSAVRPTQTPELSDPDSPCSVYRPSSARCVRIRTPCCDDIGCLSVLYRFRLSSSAVKSHDKPRAQQFSSLYVPFVVHLRPSQARGLPIHGPSNIDILSNSLSARRPDPCPF